MLDLRAIREDPEPVRRAMGKRSAAAVQELDRALRLDEERLTLLRRVEELRPGALARADGLFRWDRQPWCPQIF